MGIDMEDFEATVGRAPALSMTLSFFPVPRVAEICYVESDARLTSAFGRENGSFTYWHADGKHTSVESAELPDFIVLRQFAENLYIAVFDHNDRRFSASMNVPSVLSMTLTFLPEDRLAEIRYFEPDGRITLANEIDQRLFRFIFSNGSVHVRLLEGSPDISTLRRLATNVRSGVIEGAQVNDTG